MPWMWGYSAFDHLPIGPPIWIGLKPEPLPAAGQEAQGVTERGEAVGC